ncbi:MAG TPA: polysaccharide deacetylase family protein [Armatimonadota bacterium]|jgi:peptidoglycan/xylan/chitin deacetylase (PgdA/CDA1 family)
MSVSPLPTADLLVLLYHHVGTVLPGRGIYGQWVTPGQLHRELCYLRSAGHTFVDAAWVLEHFPDRLGEVPSPTLVTFDDGLGNLHGRALPVLQALEVPALVFVVAGQIGGRTVWEPRPGHRGHRVLDWAQICEMQAGGVTFGSHTLTHPHLTQLPAEQVREELESSRRILEEGLERPVETLAYPYGDFSEETARQAEAAGYRLAFSTVLGTNGAAADPLALRRVNIRRHATLSHFRGKLARAARAD